MTGVLSCGILLFQTNRAWLFLLWSFSYGIPLWQVGGIPDRRIPWAFMTRGWMVRTTKHLKTRWSVWTSNRFWISWPSYRQLHQMVAAALGNRAMTEQREFLHQLLEMAHWQWRYGVHYGEEESFHDLRSMVFDHGWLWECIEDALADKPRSEQRVFFDRIVDVVNHEWRLGIQMRKEEDWETLKKKLIWREASEWPLPNTCR